MFGIQSGITITIFFYLLQINGNDKAISLQRSCLENMVKYGFNTWPVLLIHSGLFLFTY